MILPLSISWVFVTNGFGHVLVTVITREYSPGLVTSLLYWAIIYLIIQCNILQRSISTSNFIISVLIGATVTILMIGHLFLRRMLRGRVKCEMEVKQ